MSLSKLFPHTDKLTVGSYDLPSQQILDLIGPLMTPKRRVRIEQVIAARTYDVVPVLENIYDRGNTSAVMRSSEAMGFQAVHLIETGEKFKAANRVTKGADKWLDVSKWKSTAACAVHLKQKGYQILATHLQADARPLHEVDFSRPTALVLGNEKDGVSAEILRLADAAVIVPMSGFVQSFNISVAGALCLYHARQELLRIRGHVGNLSEDEKRILTAHYYLRSSDRPERLIERLLARL